jgi:predicted phosphodiesterase
MAVETFLHAEELRFLEHFNIPTPYFRPASDWHSEADPSKILVLSDLHEPYGNVSVFAECQNRHKDAGTLIVPGDLGDYYSKSRFRRTKDVAFKDEVGAVFYRLQWMATHWKSVKVMLGNHDNRPEKQIASLFDGRTDILILTEQNLLTHLASYFDNVEVVGQQLDGTGINLTHLYQFGDIVFCHGEVSRARREATLEKLSMYLHTRRHMLNLKPYSVIAQGHNHADMRMNMGSESWFMLPTASDPFSTGFEYIWKADMRGHPPAVGYSVFHQDRGQTDYNSSHNYVLNYGPA